MNRAFTKIIALALLVATTFSACKKDDDNNDSLSVTKENLAATYTLSSIKVKSGSTEQDLTSQVTACEKDDQIILKSDLTVQYKDAGTVCSPAGDGTGVWSVAGSTLTLDGDDFTVKSLTKGTLVLEETYTSNGTTLTYTTTLSRK